MSDKIIVNQFSDSFSGHTNITFVHDGQVVATYGSNKDFSSNYFGVVDETIATQIRIRDNPDTYVGREIELSTSNFASALAFAQGQAQDTINGHNTYTLFCGNCVDFAGAVLGHAGMSSLDIGNYLTPGSLLSFYAGSVMNICTNSYEDIMDNVPGIYNFNVAAYQNALTGAFASGNLSNYVYGNESAILLEMFRETSAALNGTLMNYAYWTAEDFVTIGSPIVIDLDGDGIASLSLTKTNIWFDIVGDGVARHTGWLSGSDAFLAIDSNGNGKIDSVNEMFGGLTHGEGYGELSLLDTDGNGRIDASDGESYSKLLVWQDVNENGLTDDGELSTAASRGIESVSIDFASVNEFSSGNVISERSDAIVKGKVVEAGDIYFRYGSYDSFASFNAVAKSEIPTVGVQALIDAMSVFSAPSCGSMQIPARTEQPELVLATT